MRPNRPAGPEVEAVRLLDQQNLFFPSEKDKATELSGTGVSSKHHPRSLPTGRFRGRVRRACPWAGIETTSRVPPAAALVDTVAAPAPRHRHEPERSDEAQNPTLFAMLLRLKTGRSEGLTGS